MELVKELLFTALTAVLFSFLLAKLVSYAMAGGDSGSGSGRNEVVMEELQFGQRKLSVGILKSEKKVRFVEEDKSVEKVDKIEKKLSQIEDIASAGKLTEIRKDASDEKETEISDGSIKEREESNNEARAYEETVTESSRSPEKPVGVIELRKDASKEKKAEIGDDTIEEREKSFNDVIAESGDKDSQDVPISDEDDEWEGIERTDLETAFEAASKFVGSGAKDDVLSDVQMELYGLHKIATEGPCRETQPMAFMLSARAKWNAWQKLGNMSPEEAMEQYLAILSEKVPGWMEDNHHSGDAKSEPHEAGNPDAMALRGTCSGQQTNDTHQSNLDLISGNAGADRTGSLGLEAQAKE